MSFTIENLTIENQQISKPTEQLIENIKLWKKVAQNRRDDNHWSSQHIQKLTRTEKILLDIELELKTFL